VVMDERAQFPGPMALAESTRGRIRRVMAMATTASLKFSRRRNPCSVPMGNSCRSPAGAGGRLGTGDRRPCHPPGRVRRRRRRVRSPSAAGPRTSGCRRRDAGGGPVGAGLGTNAPTDHRTTGQDRTRSHLIDAPHPATTYERKRYSQDVSGTSRRSRSCPRHPDDRRRHRRLTGSGQGAGVGGSRGRPVGAGLEIHTAYEPSYEFITHDEVERTLGRQVEAARARVGEEFPGVVVTTRTHEESPAECSSRRATAPTCW